MVYLDLEGVWPVQVHHDESPQGVVIVEVKVYLKVPFGKVSTLLALLVLRGSQPATLNILLKMIVCIQIFALKVLYCNGATFRPSK